VSSGCRAPITISAAQARDITNLETCRVAVTDDFEAQVFGPLITVLSYPPNAPDQKRADISA
jgi:hypothetical protein